MTFKGQSSLWDGYVEETIAASYYGDKNKVEESFIGDLYGWRVWNLNADGFLVSAINGHPLPSVAEPAICDPGFSSSVPYMERWGKTYLGKNADRYKAEPIEVPAFGCTCGYYGYYTLDELRGFGVVRFGSLSGNVVVLTRAWGKVIRAEHGFRAQYIEPIVVFGNFTPFSQRRRKLRKNYPSITGAYRLVALEERAEMQLKLPAVHEADNFKVKFDASLNKIPSQETNGLEHPASHCHVVADYVKKVDS